MLLRKVPGKWGGIMKKIQKVCAAALLFCVLALLPAVTADAGFQKTQDGTYRYYTSRTNYIIGRFKNIRSKGKVYTYYFDAAGNMVTGWEKIQVKGKWRWYYFDRNGRMFKDRTKNGHYLKKNGQMLTDGWHEGVYYGKDGAAVPGYKKKAKVGFKKNKKGTRYRKSDGTFAQKEWLCIADKNGKKHWYYFYGTGYMAKNTWVGSRHVNKKGQMDKWTR